MERSGCFQASIVGLGLGLRYLPLFHLAVHVYGLMSMSEEHKVIGNCGLLVGPVPSLVSTLSFFLSVSCTVVW